MLVGNMNLSSSLSGHFQSGRGVCCLYHVGRDLNQIQKMLLVWSKHSFR